MKKVFYKISMFLMGIMAVCLSVLIYTKDDNRASNFNEKLGVNIDFGKVNSNIASFIDETVGLDFLKITFKNKDKEVANINSYLPKGNDLYETSDGKIIALGKGTITFLSADKTGYTFVIQYDNGINGTYSLLSEILIKNMDRVDEDDIIASGSSFKVIFEKNGKQIRYEEFFA